MTINPIRARKVTLHDLLPQGDDLIWIAYQSMAGDPATSPPGRHAGRNPDHHDMTGVSKRGVYKKAIRNDLAWFSKQAASIHIDPYTWAPSLRTLIPKSDGNNRPIDDPPEIKRLVALFVRARLAWKVHTRFTGRQLGSRPGNFCTRPGATALDHVATGIHNAIREGYQWCVAIDLKDAFGRVPEDHAIREFSRMGLEDDAAKFLWQMVKINAVTSRNEKPITRIRMGIEQGNPLSASIMDLVLAPVLRRVEARHDVQAFSYLDDIYIMTRNQDDAVTVYQAFRAIAEGFSFDNVRDLWIPGREAKGKNSVIINTEKSPVRVLKTYDIDHEGISLAPQKESEFRQDLKERKIPFQKMTMQEARDATHCQALTAKATRARNHLLITQPSNTKSCHQSPSEKSPSFPSGGCTSSSGEGPVRHQLTGVREPLAEEREDETVVESPSVEDSQLSRCIEDDHEGTANHLDLPEDATFPIYPSLDDGECRSFSVQEVPDVLLYGDVGYLPGQGEDEVEVVPPVGDYLDVGLLPLGVDGHPSLLCRHLGGDGFACSSQCMSAGSVSPPGDSTRSEGANNPCEGSRVVDGIHPVPHLLHLAHPAVQEALAGGHGFKFGNEFKGWTLDITGLDDLNLPDHVLVEVVHGLVKAVRTERTTTVVLDPVESATALPSILGNVGDQVYGRTATRVLKDGRLMVTLMQKVRKKQVNRMETSNPPAGLDALLRVHQVNRATGVFTLNVIENGERHVRELELHVASPVAGAVAATAVWVRSRPGAQVALPVRGTLAAAATMLVQGKVRSPNIDFGDAVRALLACGTWERRGQWVVGAVQSERANAHGDVSP